MIDVCKVFLSSTGVDLQDWRDAAYEAIRLTGATCIRMEDFEADPAPPAEVCQREVLGASFLVGLIGFHYGSRVPVDGRSFTQLEVETAEEVGIDCCVYVAPAGTTLATDQTGADLDAQRALRARLLAQHTSGRPEHWRDPFRLALHIQALVFRRCRPDEPDIERYRAELQLKSIERETLTTSAPPEDRERLMREKTEIESKRAEIETAYAAAQETIAGLEDTLERYGNKFGAERLRRVEEALEQRDYTAADTLLAEIEDDAELVVQGVAAAAFQRGKVAEEQVRWADAAAHYAKAARLEPSYDALFKAREFAWRAAEYKRAAGFGEDLIRVAREEFGDGSNTHAAALNEQALSLMGLGRYDEAELLFRQSLKVDEKIIGRAHPEYAKRLNNLAELLRTVGRYDEAEALYQQALEIDEKTIGKKHPSYAIRLNNLAGLLQAMGRHNEAEPLFRQALEINEETIGTEHPEYARNLNNLASSLQAVGRHDEAEPLYRQAMEIDEKTIGTEHPEFAMHLGNFAGLLAETGRLAEAEPLRRREFEIILSVHGRTHPHFGTASNNLAALLRAMGRYDEAEPLYRQALEIDEKTIGTANSTYAKHLNNLASLLRAMGRHDEAGPLYAQMMPILRGKLGDDHPTARTGAANYARLLREHFPDDPALAELEAAFGPDIGR